MKNTLIVNLFAEPGAGKSTAAAYIYSQLKMCGISAEYVTEFAKDKVWEQNEEVFKHQTYIFGKQHYKLARVVGKVDVIITDSPILLSAIYNESEVLGEEFNNVVLKVFNSYNNFNILLTREHPYEDNGRNETEYQAKGIRKKLINKLNEYDIQYSGCTSSKDMYDTLVEIIKGKIGDKNEQ